MRFVAVDTETYLIRAGCQVPKLVCVTTFDGQIRQLMDDISGVEAVFSLLRDTDVTLIGHHVCFDLAVLACEDERLLPLIFKAVHEGRVRDTKLRQQMIDNATGELKFIEDEDSGELKAQDFSLQRLVYRHTKRYAPKGKSCGSCVGGHQPECFAALCLGCCPQSCEASFRLRYGLLHRDGPRTSGGRLDVAAWPELASKYAQDDAQDTWEVYQAQERLVEPEGIPGEAHQMQAAWALYLTSCWGCRTDLTSVCELRVELEVERARLKVICMAGGVVRENGVKDMAAIYSQVIAAYVARGEPIPMTAGGKKPKADGRFSPPQPKTDVFTLKKTKVPVLKAVAEYNHVGKLLTTYLPILERGTKFPINSSYNVILETFRTSSSRPNIQNPPRKGNVRACFVPRRGWVYISADFSQLEMCTLAQAYFDFFGNSPLRDAIAEGQDVHVALAAEILGLTYEEAIKRYKAGDRIIDDARQISKPGNFGFPGGMGWRAFQDYALKSYGVDVSDEMAQMVHAGFRKRWNMQPYFNLCGTLSGEDVAKKIVFPRSKQVRGQVTYTAICNGFFQELAARGAKEALWEVVRECYLENPNGNGPTALYGCRIFAFLHDEIMLECRRDPLSLVSRRAASAAAARLSEVMVTVMKKWCPDVPIEATPVMMPRWFKGAKPKNDADGIMAPVRPVEEDMLVDGKPEIGPDGKTKKKTVWVPMAPEEFSYAAAA